MDFDYKVILTLIKKIMELLQTQTIPYVNNNIISHNMFQMVENNQFKTALELNLKYLKNKGIDKGSNIIYLLLVKINKLIEQISNQEKMNRISERIPYNKDIENILTALLQNDIEKAKQLIKQYLIQIEKEEYKYLIIKLIEISMYQRDMLYQKVASVLSELSNDEYVYNITFYLQQFYSSLNKNDLIAAKFYLEIIEKYSQELGSIIDSLKEDLEKAEKRINEEKNAIKEYLIKKTREMKENEDSIIILQVPTTHLVRKTIYNIIKKIPELIAFSIGEEPKKIVLRYLNPQAENKIEKNKSNIPLTENYKIAYLNKEYKKCISIIKDLLENPQYGGYSSKVYAFMGLSYYHLNNMNAAVKYLTISHELNLENKKRYDEQYDFTELLSKIKSERYDDLQTDSSPLDNDFFNLVNTINSRQPKEKNDNETLVVSTDTPSSDLDDNYGITNIEDIAYYIQAEKISIEVACQRYSFTDEQIQLVKLIYARDYYTESMYPQGDKLLQEVEKSKNKTKKVRDLLAEIRASKKFYKNRPNAHTRKRIMPTVNN